ncbi:hypothetical protein [Streptomyces sp. NPDC059466]|uniref:hypothetical protein n=1 Tax=unclassified Streptomyces TaxID=2593676 RepID=UPI0036AF71FC
MNEALAGLSAAVSEDPQILQTQGLKLVNHPGPGGCDDNERAQASGEQPRGPARD